MAYAIKRGPGHFEGRYKDRFGQWRSFNAHGSKAETKARAQELEARERKIREGLIVPHSADAHKGDKVAEIMADYVAWGRACGGRGGLPWSDVHARQRENRLKWWRESLDLDVMDDLPGCLKRADKALRTFLASADQQMSSECLAIDLRDALQALGEIVGEVTTDDILDRIFSEFCIGK